MNEYEMQGENTSMDEALRNELRRLFDERVVTQAQIGEKLGITQASVSRIIKGDQPFTYKTYENALKWLRPWDDEIRRMVFRLPEEDKLTVARIIMRLQRPPSEAGKEFSDLRRRLLAA